MQCGDLPHRAIFDQALDVRHFAGVHQRIDHFPVGCIPADQQNPARIDKDWAGGLRRTHMRCWLVGTPLADAGFAADGAEASRKNGGASEIIVAWYNFACAAA